MVLLDLQQQLTVLEKEVPIYRNDLEKIAEAKKPAERDIEKLKELTKEITKLHIHTYIHTYIHVL